MSIRTAASAEDPLAEGERASRGSGPGPPVAAPYDVTATVWSRSPTTGGPPAVVLAPNIRSVTSRVLSSGMPSIADGSR